MDKALKAAKKVLSLLPFDDSKLKLGGLLVLLGQLPLILPGVNVWEIVQAIIANPTKAGVLAVVVGAIHKFLKAKFPESQY